MNTCHGGFADSEVARNADKKYDALGRKGLAVSRKTGTSNEDCKAETFNYFCSVKEEKSIRNVRAARATILGPTKSFRV